MRVPRAAQQSLEQATPPDTGQLGWWAWAACIVLLVFVAGGFAGYFARPALDGAGPAQAAQAVEQGSDGVPGPPAGLMAAAAGRTRHWKGAANAPVSIVEFADFQ